MPTLDEQIVSTSLYYNGGQIDEVTRLIKGGASVNARDNQGNTPLHLAISGGAKVDLVNFLIKSGANYEATNLRGEKPYQISINSNYANNAVRSALLEFVEKNKSEKEKSSSSTEQQKLELLKQQTQLLKDISEKLDKQDAEIKKVLEKIQQPLEFEKLKNISLEKENSLLQKQLELQIELEKLRQENYSLKYNLLKENAGTSENQKNQLPASGYNPKIFKS